MSNTFFKRQVVTINPKSMTTTSFTTNPNYFALTNMGKTSVYFSANMTPTTERYDLMIPAGGVKVHVEPNGKQQVYIYNDGATVAEVVLLTFSHEFDPLVLAFAANSAALEIAAQTMSFDGVIKGFRSALPSGANTIGNVNITENKQLSDILGQLKLPLPAGTHSIGKVDMNDNAQLANILTALQGAIPTGSNKIGIVGLETNAQITEVCGKLENIQKSLEKITVGKFASGTATAAGVTITADSGNKITEISMLSNDGESDIIITLDGVSLPIKAGEVLDKFTVYCDSFTITGENVAFRMAYNERAV